MLIGVNNQHQIKQIRNITDESLTTIELDETWHDYPFKGFSDLKILCYCFKVDENGVSVYPYVPYNIIEQLDSQDTKIENVKAEKESLAETLDMVLTDLIPTLLGGE